MGTPVKGLTVLYDAQCNLCVHLRQWLTRQRQLVPLTLLPAGSEAARKRYPGLDHRSTLTEITVIGDQGQIYRGPAAWIVCLWALADHRAKSHWLATPPGRPSYGPRCSPRPSTGTSQRGPAATSARSPVRLGFRD